MPKNETGEFELVLGNRQLLSGFAVVAILFGVFFAMGYIVGRNSTPSARLAAGDVLPATTSASGQPDPGRAPAPIQVSVAPAATTDANGPSSAQPGSDPNSQPAAEAPQPTTQAARPAEAAKPPEKPVEAPAPKAQSADSLPAGAYLQVIATIQSDAEVISKSLQERHFPNVITPSSLEGRFRVLVGPYRDSSGVGPAKTELEKLGFHPILVKIAERN